jgi:uncharacterized protein (DUF1778 family)
MISVRITDELDNAIREAAAAAGDHNLSEWIQRQLANAAKEELPLLLKTKNPPRLIRRCSRRTPFKV